MLLYSLIALVIAIPTCLYWFINIIERLEISDQQVTVREIITTENISGMVILGIVAVIIALFLKLGEFFLIIYASFKSANGEYYHYPLTINFIK